MTDILNRSLALLMIALVATTAVVGVAAGAPVSYQSGDTLVNETVTIDNSTTAVWVEIENASTSSALNATVFGVNETGGNTSETLLASKNLTADGANATDLAEITIDPTVYDAARVTVVGPNGSSVERADVGLLTRTGGGAASGSSISLSMQQILASGIAIVLLGLLGWGVKQT